MNSPTQLGSIRNFAWVAPGLVARGEQPALDTETFEALREAGITAVLSLRPDREPPSPNARRPWPEYHVEDEQALAEATGMRFRNLPITDFSAPPPERVASALRIIDELVAERPGVYVHCRAGAGRAGLVSAAWGVTRGMSGDEAAESYVRFMEHIGASLNFSDDEWAAFARRVGQPQVWWALREVVDALGSPVTHEPARLARAERPAEADGWEAGYRAALRPWRRTLDAWPRAEVHAPSAPYPTEVGGTTSRHVSDANGTSDPPEIDGASASHPAEVGVATSRHLPEVQGASDPPEIDGASASHPADVGGASSRHLPEFEGASAPHSTEVDGASDPPQVQAASPRRLPGLDASGASEVA